MPKKGTFDATQKKQLLQYARETLAAFEKDVVAGDNLHLAKLKESGWVFFGDYIVQFTEEFLTTQRQFTSLAAKMLKARSAHEKTIRNLCQKAAQDYVIVRSAAEQESPGDLESAARGLVDKVLAEAGKEYTHIAPNFLIRHGAPTVMALGPVRSMPTELLGANTTLTKNPRISLSVGESPAVVADDDSIPITMPNTVWVVEVPATKENVQAEAIWLIDIAVGLMRLSAAGWQGLYPRVGDVEAYPTYPTLPVRPAVIMEGERVYVQYGTAPGWYEISPEIAEALNAPKVQCRASRLFDPISKSLAQRVAQGLGWMTRGRQSRDRAERLLAFFTALESLLTPNQENAPVTDTISRHVSIILTDNISKRAAAYQNTKRLYGLRSRVVHSGGREVLWQDVNMLQIYVERVFSNVIEQCDINMSHENFARSLITASHGLKWKCAATEEIA